MRGRGKGGKNGGSSEGSGLGSENWEMGVPESGDQSRNRNQQRRQPRPFLRPNASLKTPGLDKPECGAKAGEGELWGRQAQSGTSLRPELGVPEAARGRHGVPEELGVPRRTRLQLRLPESPSLTIAAAILDPRVGVMTSAEVVFPRLWSSILRGAARLQSLPQLRYGGAT